MLGQATEDTQTGAEAFDADAATQVITKAHNGTITIDSAPNQGTTITITLPTQRPTGSVPKERTEVDQ